MDIHLPKSIFESNILSLLKLLDVKNNSQEIIFDIGQANGYYIPAALVCLLSTINKWQQSNKDIKLRNHDRSGAYKYLQRVNFFKLLGINLEEDFTRHDSFGRFVPLQKIEDNIEKIAIDIADCIAPELVEEDDDAKTGLYDGIVYAIGELGLNVKQHSRGVGFIGAQYYKTKDYIRIAIADTGIGINNSFKVNASPFCKEINNDLDAIITALKPNVSSRIHFQSGWGYESENRGVGLSILHDLTKQLNGEFILVSGKGYYSLKNGILLSDNMLLDGTLCSIMIKRDKLNNFNNELSSIINSIEKPSITDNLKGIFL